MEFIVGATSFSKDIVNNSNTASAVGSGSLPVFATPSMIALMENAASKCAQQFLDNDHTSVGISMNIQHTSATPIGMAVTATAELIEVDGKKLTFKVTAKDEVDEIGSGIHERVVIESSKFVCRTKAKKDKVAKQ
ncbi:MAG: thioesterase family protein [Clostridiales bacterium]|nr:thioesterase family protein [Clostridiales bacterium]